MMAAHSTTQTIMLRQLSERIGVSAFESLLIDVLRIFYFLTRD